MPVLVAAALRVRQRRQTILHGISFELSSGTLTGLVGPNGSGKTTLLRTVCGYLPYTGSLRLQGREVQRWPARELARNLAVVRQASSLSFDFAVAEIVRLGLLPHKGMLEGHSKRDLENLRSVLAQVDLDGFASRRMHSLSGGEQQRVYLAQALLQNANILLLDEPTTHLDVSHQYRFLRVIRELADGGHCVVVVFHDLELAARFSDNMLVLQNGRLVAEGPPENVLTKALLADVFRMQASVYATGTGQTGITFERPTGS